VSAGFEQAQDNTAQELFFCKTKYNSKGVECLFYGNVHIFGA